MPASTTSLHRSAICRALLEIARLGHLWTGDGLKPGVKKIAESPRTQNKRDAIILETVMLLCGIGDGPSLGEVVSLSTVDRNALLLAPIAAEDPRACQVWLGLHKAAIGSKVYGICAVII